MRRRDLRVSLGLVLAVGLSLAAGVPAGTVAADHGGSADSDEIVEVWTFVTEGTDSGTVEVELGYHVGRDVSGLEVNVSSDRITAVVDTDGFRPTDDPDTYRWERGQAGTEPTLRVAVDANRTNRRFSGLDKVDTGDWALVKGIDRGLRLRARNPEDVELTREVRTAEPGSAGDCLVYVGPNDVHEFDGDGERFRLVVGAPVGDVRIDQVRDALVGVSRRLAVGGTSDTVTGFVVTDPIREGGLACRSDFQVHERSLPPKNGIDTAIHEYVHTRQEYTADESTEWSVEAEAEYYEFLFALLQGDIEYVQFHERFSHFDGEYDDVVLADPDTWTGTRADYERGGLTVAALDAVIRAESNGTSSYQDVLRAKNAHGQEVTLADVERFAGDAAGADTSEFFDRHVRSRPDALAVPPPDRLQAPESDADLAVSVGETTTRAGERTTVPVTVENTGSERSVVPYLAVEFPDAAERTCCDVVYLDDGSRQAALTVANTTPLPHLDPGERVVVEYDLQVDGSTEPGSLPVAVEAADASGTRANASGTVEVVLPETAEAGSSAGADTGSSGTDRAEPGGTGTGTVVLGVLAAVVTLAALARLRARY